MQITTPYLIIDNVSIAFRQYDKKINRLQKKSAYLSVVENISASLTCGEIGCLLGQSGCGKTTLLRAIAGFQAIQSGSIKLNGTLLSSPTFIVPAEIRRIGFVFQDYALFPHLSVQDNIGFGISKWASRARDNRITELLTLVGLQTSQKKYPHELSGGQQQRVALARALAPSPSLLLLDEPFSNLDTELKTRLAGEVRDIIKSSETTALWVTHDQHEAFAVADKIGIMANQKLQQWDTPNYLYHHPKNRFVANFIGHGVLIPGEYKVASNEGNEAIEIKTELGKIRASDQFRSHAATGSVDVLIRAEDLSVDANSTFLAEIISKTFRGAHYFYELKLDSGQIVSMHTKSHTHYPIGMKIGVRIDAPHCHAFLSI